MKQISGRTSTTPRDAVMEALGRLPRALLAVTPTPLQDAPRLAAQLGSPKILIKRDDLTGLAFGGNKVRMLEYVLGKAVASGCNTVIGGSASQSNYSRVLAGACAKLGLDCHLVLRRMAACPDEPPQGSLLLNLMYGAHVQLVDDDRALQVDTLTQLGDRLESEGRKVFRALQASEDDKTLHALPYVEAAFEVVDQLADLDVKLERIYLCSLDTTHAGLLLGLKAAGSTVEVVGVSPYEAPLRSDLTAEQEVARLANEAAEILGLDIEISPADVTTTFDFAGQYGHMTTAGTEATLLFARTEGLLLDPIYTMKAAAAMVHDLRAADPPTAPVLFWHTGGTPAVFAYASEYDMKVDK